MFFFNLCYSLLRVPWSCLLLRLVCKIIFYLIQIQGYFICKNYIPKLRKERNPNYVINNSRIPNMFLYAGVSDVCEPMSLRK